MSLCLVVSGTPFVIAATMFTLSWTHSVEKVEWQERWVVEQSGLRLVEARVKGSGAGMEPDSDAELVDGWWVYEPSLPPQKQLVLASSGKTAGGWELCAGEEKQCRTLGAEGGEPIVLRSCR
ncbi:DUF1850 domain-containing protein [Nitratireductor thuwali]|uniref:DUF1850 domain-containing protein n=1 Tax=Nitratireductor thuwali TaxID=2267699 RepID=A0ABY5MIY4_9HYPH|nr:hypothetical protein NTH_02439 [Nitratireductor thuwali]